MYLHTRGSRLVLFAVSLSGRLGFANLNAQSYITCLPESFTSHIKLINVFKQKKL